MFRGQLTREPTFTSLHGRLDEAVVKWYAVEATIAEMGVRDCRAVPAAAD
jgi:hypothetical protein